MNLEQLKNILQKSGIVGAGGAGFPLHAKLNLESEYIIINGAECEPLLRVDQQLMDKYAKQLVEALEFIIQTVDAKIGIIGLKGKYKKAQESLEKAIEALGSKIVVHMLPNTYPIGDEVSLIYECTGKVVPKGLLPVSLGVTVINVETLLNIWNAVFEQRPVTHTYVTVGGDVPYPTTFKAPIGMRVSELVKLAGRENLENHKIIMGGPMTGNMVTENHVITKTTKALLVLENNHYIVEKKKPINFNSLRKIMSACSQCRMCTDLCPRNMLGHKVEPHKLMNAVANGLIEHSAACETALGCCGCNLCSLYSCHHDLAPAEFMMKIKGELVKNGVISKNQVDNIPDQWHVYRQVPSSNLIRKLGLTKYDVDAPLDEKKINPTFVEIPLKQHIGMSATPQVVIGDKVKEGQIIAYIANDNLGSYIHSSIDGVIAEINRDIIRIERGI